MFLSDQSPTEAAGKSPRPSSLIVANTITAEQRAFKAGFQAVLEDERKSLVLRLVVWTLCFGAFVLIY